LTHPFELSRGDYEGAALTFNNQSP